MLSLPYTMLARLQKYRRADRIKSVTTVGRALVDFLYTQRGSNAVFSPRTVRLASVPVESKFL